MLDWLAWIGGGTAAGTFVFGPYIALMAGRLIPRSAHLDRIGDLKAAIVALEKTVAERERQIGVLMGRVREPAS